MPFAALSFLCILSLSLSRRVAFSRLFAADIAYYVDILFLRFFSLVQFRWPYARETQLFRLWLIIANFNKK